MRPLFVAVMFALAAFAPPDRLVARRGASARDHGRPQRWPVWSLAGLGGLLGGTHRRHDRLAITSRTIRSCSRSWSAPPGCSLYAAIGLRPAPDRRPDRVAGLIAIAMMLLAGASFSNVLTGSLVPGRIGASEGSAGAGVRADSGRGGGRASGRSTRGCPRPRRWRSAGGWPATCTMASPRTLPSSPLTAPLRRGARRRAPGRGRRAGARSRSRARRSPSYPIPPERPRTSRSTRSRRSSGSGSTSRLRSTPSSIATCRRTSAST